jgi:hypothetical protein
MSAQFSPNLIINEVGYSASLMRSPWDLLLISQSIESRKSRS